MVNSAAVISPSVSLPVQVKVTVYGTVPVAGSTVRSVHSGFVLLAGVVGVGVAVGPGVPVGVGVGVAVGPGVPVGVGVGDDPTVGVGVGVESTPRVNTILQSPFFRSTRMTGVFPLTLQR